MSEKNDSKLNRGRKGSGFTISSYTINNIFLAK